jgi:5'-3' exonuclease
MLCLEGKVDAVYSSDSDNLAYGCPRVIVGPPMMMFDQVSKEYQHQVTSIEIADVLQAMQISYPMFLDFCIMCGCDYNTNIPNVGPVKALKLITTHESIDAIPEEYDRSTLCYERCREMFTYNPSELLYTEGHLDLELERLSTSGKEFLMTQGLITYLPRLVSIYNRIPHPSRVFVSQPPSTMFVSIREFY